jgi:hypothetical protein
MSAEVKLAYYWRVASITNKLNQQDPELAELAAHIL